jgi:PEP-CTERM motif
MRLHPTHLAAAAALAVSALVPTGASAASAGLVDNRVIIDNAPFYSVGAEDGLGTGNFALNYPTFIDIPYAIFDFGATASVSSALLTWNFGELFGGSTPTQITLYLGNDASGTITTADRFMGTAANTATYAGGELRTFDVTSFVNASLGSGRYFAARFEVTAAPGTLAGYHGGNFLTPSMTYVAGAIPEPETYAMLLAGLGLMAVVTRRRTSA